MKYNAIRYIQNDAIGIYAGIGTRKYYNCTPGI